MGNFNIPGKAKLTVSLGTSNLVFCCMAGVKGKVIRQVSRRADNNDCLNVPGRAFLSSFFGSYLLI